jgi:16S rRNA (cytidine1402-2'-O)-methyltransferase
MKNNKLYIIPTPIGNLKDITLRSLEVLRDIKYIACEDTRKTQFLLRKYNLKNKILLAYFSPQEDKKIPQIIKILKNDSVGLITDAGMPLISDPGYKLIKECIKNDISIEVLPGPSAFLTALIGSGLPVDRFLFLGFLPKKGLSNFLLKYKKLEATLVFYESPFRLLKTLKIIKEIYPDCFIVIARELSKIYEEYLRGKIDDLIKLLNNKKIKGEVTVILRENFHLD